MISKIKKFGLTIASSLLLMGAMFASCSDSKDEGDNPGKHNISTVVTEPISALVAGEDLEVALTATADYVVVIPAADRSWISVKSQANDKVVLTVKKNQRPVSRVSKLLLRLVGYNKVCNVTIMQDSGFDDGTSHITASEAPYEIAGNGEEFLVAVEATSEFVTSILQADQGWLSVKSADDTGVTLKATANSSTDVRTTVVTFSLVDFPEKFCTVTISQTVGDNPYVLQAQMDADASLVGGDFTTNTSIHNYMRTYGWDYSENPNSSAQDHTHGIHGEVVQDAALGKAVFKLSVHANNEILDGDRGTPVGGDRQRNEMKSRTGNGYHQMNGCYDEWQLLTWKMKIPAGFQPSNSFTHLHQIKAQEGDNGSPLITITLRANADGSNRRVQVIHTARGGGKSLGSIVDNVAIADFEDQWVSIEQEIHYVLDGFYRIKIVRVSDGKTLVDYTKASGIDLWRPNAVDIRNKFGIYRSFGSTMLDANSRPANGIKDEHLFLADFKNYLRNINPDPQPHL